MGNMVRVVKDNGRPNRFYINDISKMNEEEKTMMTINDLMTMVGPEEAEEIMDKMVTAAREIVDDLMKKRLHRDYKGRLSGGRASGGWCTAN